MRNEGITVYAVRLLPLAPLPPLPPANATCGSFSQLISITPGFLLLPLLPHFIISFPPSIMFALKCNSILVNSAQGALLINVRSSGAASFSGRAQARPVPKGERLTPPCSLPHKYTHTLASLPTPPTQYNYTGLQAPENWGKKGRRMCKDCLPTDSETLTTSVAYWLCAGSQAPIASSSLQDYCILDLNGHQQIVEEGSVFAAGRSILPAEVRRAAGSSAGASCVDA